MDNVKTRLDFSGGDQNIFLHRKLQRILSRLDTQLSWIQLWNGGKSLFAHLLFILGLDIVGNRQKVDPFVLAHIVLQIINTLLVTFRHVAVKFGFGVEFDDGLVLTVAQSVVHLFHQKVGSIHLHLIHQLLKALQVAKGRFRSISIPPLGQDTVHQENTTRMCPRSIISHLKLNRIKGRSHFVVMKAMGVGSNEDVSNLLFCIVHQAFLDTLETNGERPLFGIGPQSG
mmetsp:Transcript_25054/g.36702  ORF Transcript_25054/g.36702 Transcript_25054/m.36702 type:complete len:228 (-) Transcript_25054:1966-2649(-)